MAAENSEDDGPEFTEDENGKDGLENQGPDSTDVGTRENELDNGQDESSGENPGDIPEENSDHISKRDQSNGSAEDFEEELTGDPVEDLNLDDLDLSDLDFEDDDADEQAGGSKKKKIILVGGGTLLGLALIALGTFFFLQNDAEPEMDVSAKNTKSGNLMMIPPKRRMRMKTGQELGGKARPKITQGNAKKIAPQPSSAGSMTPASPPKLSPNPRANPAYDPSPKPGAPANAAATSGPTNQTTVTPPAEPIAGARFVPGAGLTVPATTARAYRDIPIQSKSKPLPPPRRDMMETVNGRVLPTLGKKKEPSWQAYAHPFEAEPQKIRVSLVIRGLGLSRSSTLAAIGQLPAAVSLAFSPYTRGLEQWAGMARSNGHETLLSLPMEPMEFPASDPGPLGMMTNLDSQENIMRLQQIMGLSKAFVGLVQSMGSRFMTSDAALKPILTRIKQHGLMFVDDGLVKDSVGTSLANTLRLPNARADLIIDEDATGQQILANLRELEVIARKNKVAVGIGAAYPATVLQISRWVKTLPGKKIQLAPVSGVVKVLAPRPPQKPK